MELKDALHAEKLTAEDSCVVCSKELSPGDRVIAGEARVGGKLIGKTLKVKACLGCAQDFKEVLDLRIKEARAL